MKLYNHIAYKMCEHEAKMALHIKPGGNWKDIPLSITDARLEGIREGGGRTTYYGRLKWDAPSYTIATFFNRVPNGCNLHPEQCRVMSIREAARFQSFPDDFIFKGTHASIYKQIGNAVPPILAYYLSTLVKPHLKGLNFVDLFAGCGGLSEGFLMNGFNLLVANEFDKNIFLTNKFNHSKYANEDNFILGDITKEETKQQIFNCCKGKEVDIILGGPPCQGFSYAGWRDPNDRRNQLFRDFVTIVTELKPQMFIMENVPGILTMRNGEAIKEIIKAFAEVGYVVNTPLKINAADYGVPQRRKRVFLIGSKNGVDIQPIPLFRENKPQKSKFATLFSLEEELPYYVTTKDAIGSLPPIEDGGGVDEMEWDFANPSPYDKLMQREISFEEFYQLMKDSK